MLILVSAWAGAAIAKLPPRRCVIKALAPPPIPPRLSTKSPGSCCCAAQALVYMEVAARVGLPMLVRWEGCMSFHEHTDSHWAPIPGILGVLAGGKEALESIGWRTAELRGRTNVMPAPACWGAQHAARRPCGLDLWIGSCGSGCPCNPSCRGSWAPAAAAASFNPDTTWPGTRCHGCST